MRRGLAGLATAAACVLLLAQSAFAAGSLTVTVGSHVGVVKQPLSVTVEGFANGSDELYVFAAAAAPEECAVDPDAETVHPGDISTLSDYGAHEYSNATAGEAVDAGEFERSYTFAPWGGSESFDICVYLDAAPEATPDAQAQTSIAIPEPGPVTAPYLNEAVKEFSPVAIEEGLRREREREDEREQREREKAESERLPGSEEAKPEPPLTPSAEQAEHCLVPELLGHSLAGVRAALRRGDCRLGAVRWPGHRTAGLVVVRQSAPRGRRLPAQATVAVVLGQRRR